MEHLLSLMKKTGVIRPKDLDAHGIPRRYLSLLYQKGLVQRRGRGIYELPGADVTEHHTLAQVCKRVPTAVVCLLSALAFHNLTSQHPFEVWLALERSAHRTREQALPIRVFRFSGQAFSEGIEEHEVSGVPVRVYSLPKTIADCFKYRNKIGLDVAIEALKACRRERRCTFDDLWHYAKICRVANVMRPYMEALS
jgi:predicted transcriptional regulator of viral defense system